MYAVILLPKFRLQAALRFRKEMREQPVAVTDGQKGMIVDVSDAAERFDVRTGIPAVQGLSRCAALILLPRAVPAERSVQDALVELAGTLSPDLESTADGCVTIDLRSARIRDWRQWCGEVLLRLRALEVEGTLGVGPNPDLAFLAARRAECFLVVSEPAAFLAQLAISEIDPPPHLSALLHDWGVHTVGQLTSLPRGELADRLGPDADRLWQRASGQTTRLLRLVRPVEEFAEAFEFEHEIETVEPLLFILRRFVDQLALRLESRHRVAAMMTFGMPTDDGTHYERTFTIPAPTASADVLFRILSTHLETVQLSGHPTGVRVRIEPALPEHQQLRLFESALRDPNHFGETLARLAALVGGANVGIVEAEDSHKPDAYRVREPLFHKHSDQEAPPPNFANGLPMRRYRPPHPAQVMVVRQTPVKVESPVTCGEIREALGPYRASGGWWERERWGVEEWDVEIHGQGLFRLRREEQQWVLEGCYDNELC